LTMPRAYPLFLAEKAVEFVESAVDEVTKNFFLGPFPNTGRTRLGSSRKNGVKERIVILGTGWCAVSFLKTINTDLYNVTIISPRNHFTFTPLLAGACVGTVEFKSICEPIREIIDPSQATFVRAMATAIDPKQKIVHCRRVGGGSSANNNDMVDELVDIEFDRLIVTVGAQTNTFGIPGVREYCYFLKQVEDARRIRSAIYRAFDKASSLPDLTDSQRKDTLTFCIVGAGPTGIEFAAELRDFIEQEAPKYYPDVIQYVQIKVIAASSTVLRPFDKSLQEEAVIQLTRRARFPDSIELPDRFQLTELILDSSVSRVEEGVICLNDGVEVPYGVAVWAAGNGPLPLTLQLVNSLGPDQQEHQDVARGRLAIDPWMRVIGGDGAILAIGDCSCITTGELPATAQVASQQGEYLAKLMNKKYDLSPARSNGLLPPPKRDPARTEPTFSDAIASYAVNSSTSNNDFAKPFQFLNLGILAYTGHGSALAQVTLTPDSDPLTGSGLLGNVVWRSVYLSKQFSLRNGLLVANDWAKRQLFGRDVKRL
jgi:NADH dehydrogenase FAD-containing subunit